MWLRTEYIIPYSTSRGVLVVRLRHHTSSAITTLGIQTCANGQPSLAPVVYVPTNFTTHNTSRPSLFTIHMATVGQVPAVVSCTTGQYHDIALATGQYIALVVALIYVIPYSGKLSREKTFTNFAIFQPSTKVFSTKF